MDSQVTTELILKIKKNNICRTDAVTVPVAKRHTPSLGECVKIQCYSSPVVIDHLPYIALSIFRSPLVFKWQALCTVSVPQLYPVIEYQHFALFPQTVKQLVITEHAFSMEIVAYCCRLLELDLLQK